MARDEPRSLTFREAVEEKVGAWLGLPGQSPDHRLISRWRKRREDWRTHWHTFVAVNGGLAAINAVIALVSGALFPWFLLPLLGWGIAMTIHTLGYRAWLEDHRIELVAAAQRLEIPFEDEPWTLPSPALPQLRPRLLPTSSRTEPSRDPRWEALLTRCRRAAAAAEEVFSALPGQTPSARDPLREGVQSVERLAAGANRIQRALADLERTAPDDEIAALDQTLATTTDERLREAQLTNRALLIARREKMATLRADHERMYANAQGFSLALENLALDAARLGQDHGPTPRALSDPIERLTDEVRILSEVEAELRKLP